MRRWVCVIVLLFGFTSDSYAWRTHPRTPIAIERDLGSFASLGPAALATEAAWWLPA